MRLTTAQLDEIAGLVTLVCGWHAPNYREPEDSLIGPVFEKVVDCLEKVSLVKPLQHYVLRSAPLILRRHVLTERKRLLQQSKVG
jgi:hypothetical protein